MSSSLEQSDARITRRDPAYRRVSYALFLAGFATFSLLYCVQPLLPLFAEAFHVGPAQSSLALSLSTALLAFSILCAAPLSEKVGRPKLMFSSMITASCLNILCVVYPNWSLLLCARALEGLALGGVPAVAMAYLADEISRDELGPVMGLYVAGTAFGGMMGRVGTGLLAHMFSWPFALVFFGITGLLAAWGFLTLLPPPRSSPLAMNTKKAFRPDIWRAYLRDRIMLRIDAIGFLIMGTFVAVYNYIGFRLEAPPYALNQSQLGLLFSVYLFGMAASFLAASVAQKRGTAFVMKGGVGLAVLGVVLTLLPYLGVILFGIILLTIGFFSVHSVASSAVGSRPGEAKGYASSLYLLAYYLGSSVIGSIAGSFFGFGGWLLLCLFTLLLLLLSWVAIPNDVALGSPPSPPAPQA